MGDRVSIDFGVPLFIGDIILPNDKSTTLNYYSNKFIISTLSH